MALKVTILGCGSSAGVPMVGNFWGACDPAEPRNRRRRPSILLEQDGTSLLIDTGPDCRQQLLDAGVSHLDGIIYTHTHADHVHGIDDLRGFHLQGRAEIPVYGFADTITELTSRFNYLFGGAGEGLYQPFLRAHILQPGAAQIGRVNLFTYPQDHGVCTSLGLRVGDFAYSTDLVRLDEAGFAALAGVKIWLVAAVLRRPHPTHAHLDLVLEWINRLQPEQAFLTHMNQNMDYASLLAELPPHIRPAYDGMVITL